MNLPKITIITPSFNQADYLEQTILSVLGQDYPHLEYIVIDGGSTDQSENIIKKYEKRLHYWVSEKDRGQSHAINKGLRRATGDIITWINSDDLLTEHALMKVAAAFYENPQAMLIHGKTILFGEGRAEQSKGASPEDLQLRYFSEMPFAQCSSFFRRTAIQELGFMDEQLHFGMDYDLLIRIALNFEIARRDETFSKYRLHNKSKTVAQLSHFAVEWALVFSRFLGTVDTGNEWKDLLASVHLYTEEEVRYKTDKHFSPDELRLIVLYFLECQLHLYYQLLETEKAKQLVKLIGKIDPGFYHKRNLQKIQRRISYLNPVLIRFARRALNQLWRSQKK